MTALVDEQYGGLILWLPGNMMVVLAFFIIFGRWLKHTQQQAATRIPAG